MSFEFSSLKQETRYEGKRYTPEDVSDLIFWSFHVSQGDQNAQNAAYEALLYSEPELIPAVRELHELLPPVRENRRFDELTPWADYPLILDLTERIGKRMSSSSHVPTEEGSNRNTVLLQLQQLFKIWSELARPGDEKKWEKRRKDAVLEFVRAIAEWENSLHDASKEKASLIPFREKYGWSMLFALGLSEKRDERRKEARLPKEFQELWESAGAVVREDFGSLKRKTREHIAMLQTLFENSTGEKVELPIHR